MEMQDLLNKKVDVVFYCQCEGTRNGFRHECYARTSEGREITAVCHYINRTWEAHLYDSVKHKAVRELIDQEVNELLDSYKQRNRLTRLSKGVKESTYKYVAQKYIDCPYL